MLTQRKITIPHDLWQAVQLVARTDSESAAAVVRRALRADPHVSRALASLRDHVPSRTSIDEDHQSSQ